MQMFCASEDVRLWMTKPFLNKCYDKVWATDGHAVLMVNPEVCNAKYDMLSKSLTCLEAIRKQDDGPILTVQDMKQLLTRFPREEEMEKSCKKKPCPECHGDGTVTWHYLSGRQSYSAEYNCPECDGRGVIVEETLHPTGRMLLAQDVAVRIGNSLFRALEIERLWKAADMIGVSEVRLLHLPKPNTLGTDGALLSLSPDIHLLLASFFVEDESKIETLPIKFKED